MDKYCQRLLDVLENDEKCEKTFKSIVDFIVANGEAIDIDNRKSFERKETTDYLLGKKSELTEWLTENGIIE